MNFLRRAFAAESVLSPHSSRKRFPLLYPVSLLQHSSFSSATPRRTANTPTTRLRSQKRSSTPKTSETQVPEQSPPPPSSFWKVDKDKSVDWPRPSETSWRRSNPKTSETQVPEQSPSPPSSYSDVVQDKSVDWPRPSEIPWQTKVANSVNLIGQVKIPVKFKASSDRKYWAGTIIAQENPSSSTSPPYYWIPVIFEGDLAHIAVCHLKEEDYVYIAGQLLADVQPFNQPNAGIPPFNLCEGRENVQVMAQSINFVQGFPQPKKSFVPCKLEERATTSSASMTKDKDSTLISWRDLLNNPKQWWDNRKDKRNGLVKDKYPDFKHKDSGLGLWLNRAPEWVFPGIGGLEFDVSRTKPKQVKGKKDDDSWKHLVENPNEWWDNRSGKKNERAPDFKNKATEKALWLNNAPDWALSSLPPLKAKQSWASKAT